MHHLKLIGCELVKAESKETDRGGKVKKQTNKIEGDARYGKFLINEFLSTLSCFYAFSRRIDERDRDYI